MSSFYEDASLVMIPSGYKTSKVYCAKPTDGTGDLTFTRSNDTATRVASNGLIEKVRTNQLTYSEDFTNGAWFKTAASVTADATTAPDGTITADKIFATATSGNHFASRSAVALTGEFTFSVFAKASEYSFLKLQDVNAGVFNGTFDLSAGTASGTGTAIQSVGSGWYRCSITFTSSGSSVANAAVGAPSTSINYTGDGTSGIFIWGAQLETGVLTPYIPTTTAAVSVGPVANVPRLDYLNSTCPKLLLEPQRSSLTNFSEQFDNAYWSKVGTTILANNTTSPDGYANADKLTSSGAGGDEYIQRMGFTTTAGTYTSSIFVKNVNATATVLMAVHIGEGSITSDLRYTWSTNTFTLTGTNAVSGKATSYGNGWVRLEFTYTIGALVTGHWFRTYVQTGVSTNSIFIYGAQVELGTYATSYIPTLAASVTRGADAASKTGISSLIGQTQGTLFVDLTLKNGVTSVNRVISLTESNWTTGGSIRIDITSNNINTVFVDASVSYGGVSFNIPFVANGTYKIAVAYKANDIVLYMNGTQLGTNTTSIPIPTCSEFYLNELGGGFGGPYEATGFNQALLFKTRLSNQELQDLTTL